MSKITAFILAAGIILCGRVLGGQDGAILAILSLILINVISIEWEVRK